jgi:hypothetical protein
MAMSDAERQARRRAKLKAGEQPVVRYRKPADRRRRPEQWADACEALTGILDSYQDWKDRMPVSLADSTTAQLIDEVLELRGLVDQLAAAELPRGFGRD